MIILNLYHSHENLYRKQKVQVSIKKRSNGPHKCKNQDQLYPHLNLKSPSQYTPKASRSTAKTAVKDFINICQKRYRS
jgi:hypothetical protein